MSEIDLHSDTHAGVEHVPEPVAGGSVIAQPDEVDAETALAFYNSVRESLPDNFKTPEAALTKAQMEDLVHKTTQMSSTISARVCAPTPWC